MQLLTYKPNHRARNTFYLRFESSTICPNRRLRLEQADKLIQSVMDTVKEPLMDSNTPLQRYYSAWESRIGYLLFLGGTRHFGYYQPGTKWPFPINSALRRMEDHLFKSLGLQPRAEVLDAGCGVGHVAMHLARKGLRVHGIDIVSNHVKWARQDIRRMDSRRTLLLA